MDSQQRQPFLTDTSVQQHWCQKDNNYYAKSWAFVVLSTLCLLVITILFVVFVTNKPLSTTSTLSNQPNPPKWPSSVYIFNDSNIDSIQKTVNEISLNEQWSVKRYALLFKPGDYSGLTINMSYYTSVIGLGSSPKQVKISNINARNEAPYEAHGPSPGALNNFWRSVENVYTKPTKMWNGPRVTMLWAVSQASPMRRVFIEGNLDLFHNNGWSSGGYISNSHITGAITSGSQQQFYVRNVNMSRWNGGAWSMVFQGTENAPDTVCESVLYTNIPRTPVIAEKPYIIITDDDVYKLVIPQLDFNKFGASCIGNDECEDQLVVDFSEVYVTDPDIDTSYSINKKLRAGYKYIVISAGVYYVETAISVISSGTVILGIGFPSLIPTNGNVVIAVGVNGEDVDGVRIGGILLEAAEEQSETLLQFGPRSGGSVSSTNPAFLYDIFARVGGANEGNSRYMIQINSNNVVIDNGWLWRADHDSNGIVEDSNNYCATGLQVNGDDVTAYGLAVEHTLGDLVEWNGNDGRCYFYQSEFAYDVTQANYGDKGYVGFRVNEKVDSFQGYAIGVYSYFRDNEVVVENGIEAPKNVSGVRFVNSFTKYLNGKGGISHVISGIGGSVVSNHVSPEYVCEYP